jgi:hypothetical protein
MGTPRESSSTAITSAPSRRATRIAVAPPVSTNIERRISVNAGHDLGSVIGHERRMIYRDSLAVLGRGYRDGGRIAGPRLDVGPDLERCLWATAELTELWRARHGSLDQPLVHFGIVGDVAAAAQDHPGGQRERMAPKGLRHQVKIG